MSFSFAVVELFAFHPFRHRGKHPGDALLAVELLPSLLTQLFLRDELLHSLIPPRLVPISCNTAWRCTGPVPTDTGSVSYVPPPVELPDHYITCRIGHWLFGSRYIDMRRGRLYQERPFTKGWLLHIIANPACSLPGASSLYMPKALRPLDSSKVAPGSEMGPATEMTVNRWNNHIRNLQPKIGYSDRAWFPRSVLVGNMDCNGDQVV